MRWTLGLSLILSLQLGCTHNNSPAKEENCNSVEEPGAHGDYAQAMSSSGGSSCDPTSDIENNPQKQNSFGRVRQHCKAEIAKNCADVECKELMKPTQVCLMLFDQELSKDCKHEINRHIREFQPYVKVLDE